MFDNLLPVAIGGLIAILGNVIYNWQNSRTRFKQTQQSKKEEAYLMYVDALLKIKVDDEGMMQYKEFFPTLNKANAHLQVYGSKAIIEENKDLLEYLEECFYASNINVNGIDKKIADIINSIRKELKVIAT